MWMDSKSMPQHIYLYNKVLKDSNNENNSQNQASTEDKCSIKQTTSNKNKKEEIIEIK